MRVHASYPGPDFLRDESVEIGEPLSQRFFLGHVQAPCLDVDKPFWEERVPIFSF
jgi:hypothetical protein